MISVVFDTLKRSGFHQINEEIEICCKRNTYTDKKKAYVS